MMFQKVRPAPEKQGEHVTLSVDESGFRGVVPARESGFKRIPARAKELRETMARAAFHDCPDDGVLFLATARVSLRGFSGARGVKEFLEGLHR
jgi:hypothetical protein